MSHDKNSLSLYKIITKRKLNFFLLLSIFATYRYANPYKIDDLKYLSMKYPLCKFGISSVRSTRIIILEIIDY